MENAKMLFDEIIDKGKKIFDEWMFSQDEFVILDFKEKANPNSGKLGKEDRRNYSEALSGFLNSQGGVIVWGIEAKSKNRNSPDVVISKKPITQITLFKSELNSAISRTIIPPSGEVINEIIFENKKKDLGYIVTYVPESELPPHKAIHSKKGQYYFRSGESFLPMEHYQLESYFGKRFKPKLSVEYDLRVTGEHGLGSENPMVSLSIFIILRNVGKYLAKHASLRINAEPLNKLSEEFGGSLRCNNIRPFNHKERNPHKNGYLLTIESGEVIHPTTHSEACHFKFENRIRFDDQDFSIGTKDGFQINYTIFAENMIPISSSIVIDLKEIIFFIQQFKKEKLGV